MPHFSLEEWVDLARGAADTKKRTAMRNHLDAGCTSCASMLNFWQRVHGIAQREKAFEPPDRTVRAAKGMLALRQPQKRRSKTAVAAVSATLLFDSFSQPKLAGVRSSESAIRQLLYQAAEFHVDFRIEPQEDPRKVAVVGQILNVSDPEESLGQIPVALFRHAKLRAEAITNRFGEFRLECLLESGLYLRVSIPEGPELRIPVLEPILSEESKAWFQPTDSAPIKRILPGKKKSTRTKD